MRCLKPGHRNARRACARASPLAWASGCTCMLLVQMELHTHTCQPLIRKHPLFPSPRRSARLEKLGNSERDNIINSLYRTMKINSSMESCWHSKINCMQSGYSEMSWQHRQWSSVEKCCFDLRLKSDDKIIFLFIRNGQKVLFCKMLHQIFETIYRTMLQTRVSTHAEKTLKLLSSLLLKKELLSSSWFLVTM